MSSEDGYFKNRRRHLTIPDKEEGVDGIVDTAVAGDKAAEHFTVCSIDDTVTPKQGTPYAIIKKQLFF